MALTPKILASGQLAAASSVLYTVPAVTETLIKTITYVNTAAGTTYTVNVRVVPTAGTARYISPVALSLPAGYMMVLDEAFTLGAADAIQGWASTASIVDYTIFGVEQAS